MVLPNLLLFSIETYTFAYQVSTAITPYIEWHFEPEQSSNEGQHGKWNANSRYMLSRQGSPDDQNTLVNFLSSLPQRVLALLFVHAAFLGIPFWGKIEVVGSRSR